jgi:hypothetical protein
MALLAPLHIKAVLPTRSANAGGHGARDEPNAERGGQARLCPPYGDLLSSFATSKFNSIMTLFGSVRKICQRRLFGT